jgi:hypothetical protein
MTREDGKLRNVEIWQQNLNGIRTIRRNFESTMLNTRSLWFKFGGKISDATRITRNSLAVDKVEEIYENYCPCDETAWAKLCEYHDKMENGRNRNAQRFPPELRRKNQLNKKRMFRFYMCDPFLSPYLLNKKISIFYFQTYKNLYKYL